jgi:pimeloyl-ACP methyl ester carboxylesterase
MKRLICITILAIGFGATGSSGAWPWQQPARNPAPPRVQTYSTFYPSWVLADPRPDPRPLVWVLDGAGDLKGCSNALTQVNTSTGNAVELSVFPWSHGYRRLLMDQIDLAHAKLQGARLSQAIQERKAQEPGRRIVVVAHSAGCAVALAACDLLPRDCVDRVVLLAPSVSTGYDIRPTLWSAKEGVDVFCSTKDWLALGFVIHVVGTTDNFWSGSAAGRWGFRPKTSGSMAELETSRLRQHFWSQDMAWTGHTGGHHGMHAPAFVQTYLLPLMTGAANAEAAPLPQLTSASFNTPSASPSRPSLR